MKVLVFSDIHIDAVTAGKPRRAEVLQFLARVRELAATHQPDLVVFSGDAHDSGALLDPLYSSDLIDTLLGFEDSTVAAIPGNHDVVDTSELFQKQPISTLTPARAASRFIPLERNQVYILERPQVCSALRVDGWAVIALPYVAKAHRDHNEAWLDETFAYARALAKQGYKFIVVGHLVVPGARLGSESAEMAKGQDQMFPFERIAALGESVTLVLNGHYHAQQTVVSHGVEIVIPGSPLRFTFGEIEHHSKGVFIAEFV